MHAWDVNLPVFIFDLSSGRCKPISLERNPNKYGVRRSRTGWVSQSAVQCGSQWISEISGFHRKRAKISCSSPVNPWQQTIDRWEAAVIIWYHRCYHAGWFFCFPFSTVVACKIWTTYLFVNFSTNVKRLF